MNNVFYSELPPDKCMEILASVAQNERRDIGFVSGKKVHGKGFYSFTLQRTRRTKFQGTIRPHQTGSIIEGSISFSQLEKIVTAFFLIVFFIAFVSTLVIFLIGLSQHKLSDLAAYLLGTLFFFGIDVSFYFGLRAVNNIEKDIRDFLKQVFVE